MAADFMALSGLDNQIHQMPRWYATLVDQVFAGIELGGHRIPGKTKRIVRQTFLDAMDGNVLQEEVRHRLGRELPEDVAKPTVAWLRTDLGRRITALENEASSPETTLQQAAFAMQLQLEPPSPDRMQLTRRLEEATGSSDRGGRVGDRGHCPRRRDDCRYAQWSIRGKGHPAGETRQAETGHEDAAPSSVAPAHAVYLQNVDRPRVRALRRVP
jgi:hypothetical protein